MATTRGPSRSLSVAPWEVAASVIPLSALLWNPWGLTGRHELRLFVLTALLGFCAWSIVRRRTIYLPRWWPVAGGFLAVLVLSVAASSDFATTVFGHADRHLGLLGWMALCGSAVVGVNLSTEGRRRFRLALEVASIGVAVHALVEVSPLDLLETAGSGGRPTSTFGSATYTGAFLVLGLTFLTHRSIEVASRRHQIAGAVGGAIVGLALVLTQSRGAWIGGVTALLALAWSYRRVNANAVRLLVASLTVVVCGTVFGSAEVRARLASFGNVKDGTAGGRLVLWRSAVDAITERPFLGWGPDRTRVGLPPTLPRSFEARFWDQTVPDRAHNVFLDVGVTVGFVGMLLFLVLFVGALAGMARNEARAGRSDLTVWIVAAWAHVPHLLFNFIQLDIDLIAAAVFGVACRRTAHDVQPATPIRSASSLMITACFGCGVVFAGGVALADHLDGLAVRAEQRGELALASARYSQATLAGFGDGRSLEVAARFERRRGNFDGAIRAADRASRRHPGDFFYAELSAIVRAEAGASDPSQAAAAVELYDELLSRWPNHGRFHTGLGVAEVGRSNLASAEHSFRTAIELSPLSPEAYLNLALLQLQRGDVSAATTTLDQGIARAVNVDELTELRATVGS